MGRLLQVSDFVFGRTLRVLAKGLEALTPKNSTVITRWLRPAEIQPGDEVCIFVAYAPGSHVPEHSLFHARAWANAGFRVVVAVNTNHFDQDPDTSSLDFASGVLVRENRGYDFGAWASALSELPTLKSASILAIANDSMYGPLNSFITMVDRARSLDADVIGATESTQVLHHFQSFLIFFKPAALRSSAFWKFWRGIRAGGRIIAVLRYELGLMRTMQRAGLRCAALFPCADTRNPTLARWKELVDQGFPYVKIALLRDNYYNVDLTGWEDVMRAHGYDPSLALQKSG